MPAVSARLWRRLGAKRRRLIGAAHAATLIRTSPGFAADPGCVYFGRPLITLVPGSRIHLGARCVLTSTSEDTALGVAHPVVLRALTSKAVLTIGPDTGMSGGTVCAAGRVSIGARCLLGSGVTITDTNFHPVETIRRRNAPLPESRAEDCVVIGDDVFLGTGVVVLPGSCIGNGAVIGAGSVVRGVIPERCVAAGNPARQLRRLSVATD